jgi:iron complex transport system substrate-binding protein
VRNLFFFISLSISSFAYSTTVKIPQRVISTLPSITEMVYFLGAGDKLVGVTPYCNFPAEASKKPKVGSSFSLNIEMVVSLKPDLVLLAPTQGSKIPENLKKLGINYELIPYERLSDVEVGLKKINLSLGLKKEELLQKHFDGLKVKKKFPAKVLIVIGEDIQNGFVKSIRVAGTKTFYSDLLMKLGAQNAYRQEGANYPKLDLERIMRIKFDYILRVGDKSLLNKEIVNKWKTTSYSKRVKFIFKDYAVVPGPRVNLLFKDMMEVLDANDK